MGKHVIFRTEMRNKNTIGILSRLIKKMSKTFKLKLKGCLKKINFLILNGRYPKTKLFRLLLLKSSVSITFIK
jgi:CRISPR/Cas system-associated protein Cas10 (large subunit of type III CRISPR-Cas system)